MKIHVLVLFVLLGIMMVPLIHAFEGDKATKITVEIFGEAIIELDSTNPFLRASVEVLNYDPSESGNYFMKIINSDTGEIIDEDKISISSRDDQVWGSEVGTIIDDTYTLGDYELLIYTEFGNLTSSANFSIVESSESTPITNNEVEEPISPSPETQSSLVPNKEIEETQILSPRQQMKSGISPTEVICKDGLGLIFKASNNQPACILPSTAIVLIERGWASPAR